MEKTNIILAISILNRNGINDTIKCINSILKSDFHNYIIYVLDNGSNNKEFNTLLEKYGKHNKIKLFHSENNLGFTGGNNFILNKVLNEECFDFVLLLNNDCIIDKTFLSKFIKKANEDGIYGPIIKSPKNRVQAIGSYINMRTGSSIRIKSIESEYKKVDYVTGSCMLIPTKLIKNIGYLDDKFFAYWEESDFCIRSQKKGYKCYAVNINGVIHKEETATKKNKPYYTYLMFRNRILFLKKHATKAQYIFSYLILGIYLLIIFPKKFGINKYKYAFKGIIDGIKGIGGPFLN